MEDDICGFVYAPRRLEPPFDERLEKGNVVFVFNRELLRRCRFALSVARRAGNGLAWPRPRPLQETRHLSGGPLPVAFGVGNLEALLGACDAHVHEASLFAYRALALGQGNWHEALAHAHQKDSVPFEALRGVEGGKRHRIGLGRSLNLRPLLKLGDELCHSRAASLLHFFGHLEQRGQR